MGIKMVGILIIVFQIGQSEFGSAMSERDRQTQSNFVWEIKSSIPKRLFNAKSYKIQKYDEAVSIYCVGHVWNLTLH